MKRKHSLTVRGTQHEWAFVVEIDPRDVDEMRADGVHIDGEIYNTVPGWVATAGLVRPWCFLQDLFNLRNPMKG